MILLSILILSFGLGGYGDNKITAHKKNPEDGDDEVWNIYTVFNQMYASINMIYTH